MEANIVLIGMPACGKTTIGYELAEKLPAYSLFDTDSLIEKTTGYKIVEIFAKYSEDYFRKLEYDTIKMVCNGTKRIISVGGGAFENPDNRITLLKFGKVFYLKSDLDVLYYRITNDTTRPLLNSSNPKLALKNLLDKREANYNKAHYIVDTESMSEEDIVNYIIGKINATKS